MTTAVESTDRIAALEAKIDALSEQILFLSEEAAVRNAQRRMYTELMEDLSPIAGDAMAVATRELEDLRQSADLGDVVHLLKRLVEVAPTLDKALVLLASVSELAEDAAPLTGDAMAVASDRLEAMHRKGYFGFAKAGLGVVDKIVANFDETDVEQLGENVVTMLETIKEITQPEMLVLLNHMLDGLQRQRSAIASEPAEAPSLWALSRKLRDPHVRKGIGRALNTLGAVSAETDPENLADTNTHSTKGDR